VSEALHAVRHESKLGTWQLVTRARELRLRGLERRDHRLESRIGMLPQMPRVTGILPVLLVADVERAVAY